MENSTQISSLAVGLAKGLPRRIREHEEDFCRNVPFPPMTRKRKVNYKRVIDFMFKRYNGLLIGQAVFAKGTKQEGVFFIYVCAESLSEVCIKTVTVELRDPRQIIYGGFDTVITRHALQRLYDRLPDQNKDDRDGDILQEISGLIDFLSESPDEGIYEVGTQHGMFTCAVVKRDAENSTIENHHRLTAITWVDEEKLFKDQFSGEGFFRKIPG